MTNHSSTEFRHADGDRLLDFWRSEFATHHVQLREPEPGVLIADAGSIRVTVRVGGGGCRIDAACTDTGTLPDVRTGISKQMEKFDPTLAPLVWSGAEQAGTLPSSFATAEVTDCRPLGQSWWRMSLRLEPENFARFSSEDHWHFRLLRAKDSGREPVWPRLNDRGVIDWPEEDDGLLIRIFTARLGHPETGTIEFDIYRHPMGQTCDWAETLPRGQTVGLMGPGAEAGPDMTCAEGRVLAGGDETSIPAILRSIEAAAPGIKGKAFLLAGSIDDVQPMDVPGVEIAWLLRAEGASEETLVASVEDELGGADSETRLWFAASKRAARRIRESAITILPADNIQSFGFWS